MIYESYIYKDELKRIADRMERRLLQKRWTDHSWFLFEKDVFVSFFIIRKLMETKQKISTRTSNINVKLLMYKATGKTPTAMNNLDIDNLYVMDDPHHITKSLSFICNQMIHSYVFCPYLDKNPLSLAVLFNSFYERTTELYHLSATDLVFILRKISEDYPSSVRVTYNPEKQDYDCWAGDAKKVKT